MEEGCGGLTEASNSGNAIWEMDNFECNICLDLAQDPIVTLCGHLYCWPCLYSWLNIHSQSQECPVCKAVLQEKKLVPIYGRGKSGSELRSRSVPEVNIPHRPAGQRPETARPPDINYFRQDELGPVGGFMPMPNARFGNLTWSALFGAIPAFFNFQGHGFHDATLYGATTGVPYMFTSSFHGGYVHGFHQYSTQGEGVKFIMKLCFLVLGFLFVVHLILS